jgi:hypothetical protein
LYCGSFINLMRAAAKTLFAAARPPSSDIGSQAVSQKSRVFVTISEIVSNILCNCLTIATFWIHLIGNGSGSFSSQRQLRGLEFETQRQNDQESERRTLANPLDFPGLQ